jgi:hypothetical protein
MSDEKIDVEQKRIDEERAARGAECARRKDYLPQRGISLGILKHRIL